MKDKTITPYDVADHLRTPEQQAAYLDAWLQLEQLNTALCSKALGDILRANSMMTAVAREAALSRESLYKALSGARNPGFDTIVKVMKSLGLRFRVEPVETAAAQPSDRRIKELRETYKPTKIRVLFVAESPPESNEVEPRFFYNPHQERYDNMFRSMMRAVFENYEYQPGKKDDWLQRFRKCGYYLIDATDEPINRLTEMERVPHLKRGLSAKLAEINRLVEKGTPIILIKKSIFDLFNEPLRGAGHNVVHDQFLPFPSFGNQTRFIEECRQTVEQLGQNIRKTDVSSNR